MVEQFGSQKKTLRKTAQLSKGGGIMLIDSKRKRGWGQKWCYHGPDEFELDISGKNVLIGREFYYFGKEEIVIPARFKNSIKEGPQSQM
jgi:hypothetical protein